MTREELHALLTQILGIRLQPIERATILHAIDIYAKAEADRIIRRQLDLADVPANGPEE